MIEMLQFLPNDINIEDILTYLPADSYRLAFSGLHKRNSYCDIISYDESEDGKIDFQIGRRSLYNSLPEYMFHPVNRFDNIPEIEKKERFAEEYAKQEQEKENAYRFFAPLDILLLELKINVKDKLRQYYSSNKIMQDIIGDTLSEIESNNRFVKRVIPYLPYCKAIRGNKTLITLLIRQVLFEEGLMIQYGNYTYRLNDVFPHYNCEVVDELLNDTFVGNEYDEQITTYSIHYWSDDECTEQFDTFLDELDVFRGFIQDYFFSIEDILKFQIVTDGYPLRLSENLFYNYLNYNTNI